MESRRGNILSDAEWYCRKDPEEERFYEIFFLMCQKYGVRWASASEKERQFMHFAQAMAQKISAKQYYLSPLEEEGEMNIHQTIRLIGLLNATDQANKVHWQLSVQTHKWAGIE